MYSCAAVSKFVQVHLLAQRTAFCCATCVHAFAKCLKQPESTQTLARHVATFIDDTEESEAHDGSDGDPRSPEIHCVTAESSRPCCSHVCPFVLTSVAPPEKRLCCFFESHFRWYFFSALFPVHLDSQLQQKCGQISSRETKSCLRPRVPHSTEKLPHKIVFPAESDTTCQLNRVERFIARENPES